MVVQIFYSIWVQSDNLIPNFHDPVKGCGIDETFIKIAIFGIEVDFLNQFLRRLIQFLKVSCTLGTEKVARGKVETFLELQWFYS